MADTLLDIYGNYNRALQRYSQEADRYNAAGRAWQKLVEDYNASVLSDPNLYNSEGNFKGQYEFGNTSPYTYYNGYTVGRTNPTSTYKAQRKEYTGSDEYGNPVTQTGWYDPSTGLGLQEGGSFNYANENAYLNPQTGLISVFAARPANEFTMEIPTVPIEPMGNPPNTMLGNIDQTQLYQSLFGKGTPDMLSNEAWSLQNISTPFLSTETSAYETGGVNRMNNPLYYAQPNLLTTGQGGVDINSSISGQQVGNLYY